MVRTCLLIAIAFILTTTCYAQLSPTQGVKPTSKSTTAATEDEIIAEINGANALKEIKPRESLLDAAKKFFSPSNLQAKYASLLNMLPAMLTNVKLLQAVDDWYGTKYRYGGTTKSGIDCSAFVRAVYKAAFGIELPRTAREQYGAASKKVTDLQLGDLLFFNTTGGVSHVGMYLGNNRFVHASCSRGVAVSSLTEAYYASRYLGARRINN